MSRLRRDTCGDADEFEISEHGFGIVVYLRA
jgi:hypothetical protein